MKNNRDHIEKTYLEALKTGKEIVIIPADPLMHSSIFYCTRNEVTGRYDRIKVFSRHLGIIDHPLTIYEIVDHILKMIDENAHVYIRGL